MLCGRSRRRGWSSPVDPSIHPSIYARRIDTTGGHNKRHAYLAELLLHVLAHRGRHLDVVPRHLDLERCCFMHAWFVFV